MKRCERCEEKSRRRRRCKNCSRLLCEWCGAGGVCLECIQVMLRIHAVWMCLRYKDPIR
jgi:hypothetical protein